MQPVLNGCREQREQQPAHGRSGEEHHRPRAAEDHRADGERKGGRVFGKSERGASVSGAAQRHASLRRVMYAEGAHQRPAEGDREETGGAHGEQREFPVRAEQAGRLEREGRGDGAREQRQRQSRLDAQRARGQRRADEPETRAASDRAEELQQRAGQRGTVGVEGQREGSDGGREHSTEPRARPRGVGCTC
eukprot:CAMPEP_0179976620 /NCGR_PEP_ID=MMETSP0983-20121128/39486_1 /TAXON_ID=483367 /ORGANISM="non described non described, Strain CCMP 2436" /LENGTH=191 /DNA_ID=CAMNT_0021893479 /DNA_START=93 /DNA_END=668 /DNA_ORIENTATION=+